MLVTKEKILLTASVLWYFAEGMFGPLFGLYCTKVGGTLLDVSWAWALYLITLGIVIIIVGYVSDKLSKEMLLLTGYIINTLCTFGYLLVNTQMQLLIVQLGLGIGTGLSTPTWYALYSRYEDAEQSGFAWGLSAGLNSIFGGIALLFGGWLIANYSYTALFIIMGAFHTLATYFVYLLLKSK